MKRGVWSQRNSGAVGRRVKRALNYKHETTPIRNEGELEIMLHYTTRSAGLHRGEGMPCRADSTRATIYVKPTSISMFIYILVLFSFYHFS